MDTPRFEVQGRRIVRARECADNNCARVPEARDEFLVRQWLRSLKGDAPKMTWLRSMISAEAGPWGIPHATDEQIIDHAAQLIASGIWHVHAGGSASRPAPTSDRQDSNETWKKASVRGVTRSVFGRKRWRPKLQFRGLEVVRAEDLVEGEEFLDPATLRGGASGLAFDFHGQGALAEVGDAVDAGQGPVSPAGPAHASLLVRRVEEAFHKGKLVLVRPPTPGGGGEMADRPEEAKSEKKPPPQSAPPPPPAPKQEKTWFRVRLLDEDGEPMANEDYVIVDSAGARRTGKLDSNGECYIPPVLPEGICQVSFPNIRLNPRTKSSAS